MNKKLVRSETNRMFSGVIGGIGAYFNIDATILRLIFVITLVFTAFFPLGLIYIASIFIIPSERDV